MTDQGASSPNTAAAAFCKQFTGHDTRQRIEPPPAVHAQAAAGNAPPLTAAG